MYMNTLKPGKIYYIIYEFNPHVGQSIEKAKCIQKTQSERLEKDEIVFNGKAIFEIDKDSPYHNRYMFDMHYIKDHVFAEFTDAYNKLNELKQQNS